MDYLVVVEASGYADPAEDSERLLNAAEALMPEARVLVDEDRQMLALMMPFDAQDGRDAHDEGMAVWGEAWESAFGDLAPPSALAVRCTPGVPPAAPDAPAAAAEDDDDLYADVDAELEAEARG